MSSADKEIEGFCSFADKENWGLTVKLSDRAEIKSWDLRLPEQGPPGLVGMTKITHTLNFLDVSGNG